MNIREEMELDKIKREERLQQFIKEERARVLARRKTIAEKEKQGEWSLLILLPQWSLI